ncbi:SRPBCC family protein [Streptomyces qinzhouensis]|uniref:SRPBCC family protein n=1 Tax=Streptomyces qinzhouensis TaxID=2599401 RepID=A0A5B8IMZ4_9ACTN|nr:SRPBCC family protein [Streptomyces qinzhouensis]QDY80018.1 SRPBCC family protein [Streptomyces qinzhouensis]
MAVRNVHERRIAAPPERIGALLDRLASSDDPRWPVAHWPRMRLEPGLAVGATGGHGPVRYTVVAYEPGRQVRFRFTGPAGFDGHHELTVRPADDGTALLRHTLLLVPHGPARLTWPLFFRPLHNALIEDAFDRAEQSGTGTVARPARWSPYTSLLRAAARAARHRPARTR